MCIAVPSLVTELRGMSATVECFGVPREVSTALMTEPIAVGDYVLVRSGVYAVERVERHWALECLSLMEELLAGSDAQRHVGQQMLGLAPAES